MARFSRLAVLVVAAVLLIPTLALAQGASIAGTVKDSQGGVLPGVTVEATSPALIEKVRTATTDGRGQYNIVNLRPGEFAVTFTLPGFSVVKHEGIALTGSFTATVDAEMKVGAQEETITVTAAATTIDVQSATRQRVVTVEVIDALPTSRVHSSLATLIPGISATKADIGGTTFSAGFMQGHGSRGNDSRIMTDGISVAAFRGFGAGGQTTPDVGAMQEMTFDYAGASAENPTGGIRVNLVPREGGNSFKGAMFYSFANGSLQNNNLTPALIARGLTVRNSVKANHDFNPGFGGPIKRDKLWFYLTFRSTIADNYVGGLFTNANAANPAAFTFVPTTQQVFQHQYWTDAQMRLTWQVSPRNKLSLSEWTTPTCQCNSGASATTALEAANSSSNDPWYQTLINYQSPLTNRLLLESTLFYRFDIFTTNRITDASRLAALAPITEQSTSLTYRGLPQYQRNEWQGFFYRAAVSYVTGTHNIKVGFNNQPGSLTDGILSDNPFAIRVSKPLTQGGVVNQMTLKSTPYYPIYNVARDLGIFAQDKWTMKRLTLTYGLRYDNFKAAYPLQHFGPAQMAPNREITFQPTDGENWKDIEPKSAAAFDLFGDQKTAVKVSLNRYVAGEGSGGLTTTLNPFTALVSSTTRSWTDANGNFIPDCDILNPVSQDNRPSGGDFCGAMSNSNFGTNVSNGVTVDPKLANGWNKRESNWEFSAGAQHQISQGVSLEVSYFRRWYGNFTVTDDLNVAPSDFDTFSITAPTTTPFATTAPAGTTLPGTPGYVINNLFNVQQAKFGQPSNNFVTLASNYGKQTEHWNGVDVMFNAHLFGRLTLQGGTSTGRDTTDNCQIRAKIPESAPTNPFCATSTGWLTDIKGFATYTIPKIEVLTSVTFQDVAGPPLAANYTATNAVVLPSLQRNLSGNAANVSVPLFSPGAVYGDRLHQLDLRVGKVVKVRGVRTVFNVDLFNALNASTVLTENSSFDVWRQPTSLLMARFVKFGVQLDF